MEDDWKYIGHFQLIHLVYSHDFPPFLEDFMVAFSKLTLLTPVSYWQFILTLSPFPNFRRLSNDS